MISTREARLAAETWMREEAGRHPELVGAILAGSTRTRDPEEPHPPSSDVDLFIYVDAEVPSEIVEPHGRFAPRKLAFRGVVLEPSFHEAQRIADPEAVTVGELPQPDPRRASCGRWCGPRRWSWDDHSGQCRETPPG